MCCLPVSPKGTDNVVCKGVLLASLSLASCPSFLSLTETEHSSYRSREVTCLDTQAMKLQGSTSQA